MSDASRIYFGHKFKFQIPKIRTFSYIKVTKLAQIGLMFFQHFLALYFLNFYVDLCLSKSIPNKIMKNLKTVLFLVFDILIYRQSGYWRYLTSILSILSIFFFNFQSFLKLLVILWNISFSWFISTKNYLFFWQLWL